MDSSKRTGPDMESKFEVMDMKVTSSRIPALLCDVSSTCYYSRLLSSSAGGVNGLKSSSRNCTTSEVSEAAA